MTNRSSLACLLCLLAIAYAGLSGCRPADDREPAYYNGPVTEERRDTYAGAVAEIESMRNTMRDAFAEGDVPTAHDVLHHVNYPQLLASIPEHAQRESMDEAEVQAVREDTEKLRELFQQVDAHIHGHEGASYDEVSDEIDAAVERLRERATN